MDFQTALEVPFEGGVFAKGTTIGDVIDHWKKLFHLRSNSLDEMQSALRISEEERARLFAEVEELKKQIDSTKLLDLLTRSSLVTKLQISEESELGRTVSEALIAALRGLTQKGSSS